MDEQDIIDLLELQRLTRELLDHLTAMFPVEEARGCSGRWQMVSTVERETDTHRQKTQPARSTVGIVDPASRVELTLLPTCLPGKVVPTRGCGWFRQRSGKST